MQRDRKTWAIMRMIINDSKPRIDTDIKLGEKSIKVIIIAFHMLQQLSRDRRYKKGPN